MYWEDPPRPRIVQVVRRRDWKVMRRGKGKPLELYNLAEDIHEDHNVADQHPDIVAIFEKYLKTARTESPNWPEE